MCPVLCLVYHLLLCDIQILCGITTSGLCYLGTCMGVMMWMAIKKEKEKKLQELWSKVKSTIVSFSAVVDDNGYNEYHHCCYYNDIFLFCSVDELL